MNLRIEPKKRLVREKSNRPCMPETIDQVWSIDFMHDPISAERGFHLFNVLDPDNREGLGIEVVFLLASVRVIHALEQVMLQRSISLHLKAAYLGIVAKVDV